MSGTVKETRSGQKKPSATYLECCLYGTPCLRRTGGPGTTMAREVEGYRHTLPSPSILRRRLAVPRESRLVRLWYTYGKDKVNAKRNTL